MNRPLANSGFPIGSIALLIGVVLLPVVLAAVVFPTPLYDTRELVAWGRHFPLITPVHPPMMVWVGGAVDWLFGPGGVPIVLAGQILLVIGLVYVHAILRLLTDQGMAAFITTLAGTSFYVAFGPLSWALNADILQLTCWPAVLYHFLRGSRTDRWLHWILLGIWAAATVLTKYSAAILFFAMAVAVLALPAFRASLRRPGPYVALLIAAVLVVPHALAALRYGTTFAYGERHFTGAVSLQDTARRLGNLLLGYLPMLLPGAIVIAITALRRMIVVRVPRLAQASDELKFVVIVNLVMFAMLCGMIVVSGLEYIARYGAPFAELAILPLAPLFSWREGSRAAGERQTAAALGLVYGVLGIGAAIAYLMFASHSALQEPTAQVARLVLADWNRNYNCGPGYFLGDRQTVYGIGIAAGRDADSLTIGFIPQARWFDADRLRRQGAVLIYTSPQVPAEFAASYPTMTMTDEQRLSVPVLRTSVGKTKEYFYRFVGPADCRK